MQPHDTPHNWAFKDISGQRFGRLVAIETCGKSNDGRWLWRCLCDCGNETIVLGKHLRSGHTKSCNCYQRDRAHSENQDHGLADTPLYKVWQLMKNRCTNPNYPQFYNYGGRGITVCDEWMHDYQAFHDYVTRLPHCREQGYSLDRIDNNAGYEKANLRWVTRKEQNRNQRRTTFLTFRDETLSLSDWADRFGINGRTVYNRIHNSGWTIERALTTPVKVSSHADSTMSQDQLFPSA